ncbi:MAG: hypothetical protein JO307_03345 [Bryobacterales bacterium]|nr:hypothetical protein [Bryobacterales bacterium]MBV9401282.1 hypothetical protein [Bryobacterales bacterium]
MATVALLHSGPLRKIGTMNSIRDAAAFVFGPLTVAAAFAVGIVRRNKTLLWTSAPLVFASAALVFSHFVFGRPYPEDRTGIYFAPLACVSLVSLAYWAKDVSKAASAALCGVGALLILCFVTEFNVRKFWVWEYDADTRTIANYIAGHRDPTANTVQVGGSWQLTESMYYYLIRNRWEWMQIERRPPEPGYSSYALLPQDESAIKAFGLKVVYVGPVSGSILAVPAGH